MKPLLILGLDGLDRYFIRENLDELPNFRQLEEDGQAEFLESILPPITVPAWACSFTGKRPERLGRFDFQVIDFEDYSFDPVPGGFEFEEFWEFLDVRSAVADVPGADTREMNGSIIGGILNVSGQKSFPEGLYDEMVEDTGDIELTGLQNYGSEKKRRRKSFEYFENRKKMLEWLMKNQDASVYFTVFRLPDNMMHHCDNDDQMLEAYRKCDEYLGELMERDLNIIILSDHGAVKADTRFSINTWLKQNDYLEQKEAEERPFWKQKVYQVAEKMELLGFRDLLVWANSKYEDVTGEPFADTNLDLESVDWENTEAFSYMTGVCAYSGIWINDGRFSSPAVDDLEAKKQQIKNELSNHECVKEVLTREEAFEVDVKTFPDLVAVLGNKVKNDSDIKPSVTGEISSYMHRKQGYIAFHGEVFKEAVEGDLYDLAPTVLHYFGEEIPEEMDGEVLDVFNDDSEPGQKEVKHSSNDVVGLDV